jgi:hypothetical protein
MESFDRSIFYVIHILLYKQLVTKLLLGILKDYIIYIYDYIS